MLFKLLNDLPYDGIIYSYCLQQSFVSHFAYYFVAQSVTDMVGRRHLTLLTKQ